ncbi:efflux RND transporter periplasmic adaptor subunit [Marivirga arenosa]|uniref:Efflux RND transporter periplasmic adaptor subunit n=1 Tax=Marivirga arenosa TaxID=3059076 RepID=A0AA51N6F4_9BACT|nr:efflux RND transporter periplasmic adaptor subunit [Marivirga sp. ABR2-2]WMN07007.1 efflux RND transporter periplasmic adaptor subunit [Marivirga sp. ABR2-2]
MKINYIILSMLLVISACSEETQLNSEEAAQEEVAISLSKEQLANSSLKIAQLKKAPLDKKLTVFGELAVAPEDIANVHIVQRAFINGTSILPGDKVKKGQSLATISHPDILTLQSEYLASINTLKQLQADFERKKSLVENKAISLKSYQQTEAKYYEMKVNTDAKKSMLQKLGVNISSLVKGNLQENLHIRAPFSGFVTAVYVKRGMLAEPNMDLFEIVNLDEMHLEFLVYPKDIHLLKEEQRVSFKLPESHKSYDSKLHLINKKLTGNAVLAHADIPEQVNIPLGAQLEVTVHSQTDSLLLMPKKGILRQGNHIYIFEALADNQFNKVEIQMVAENEEYIGIDPNSLNANKNYVIEGAYYLSTE